MPSPGIDIRLFDLTIYSPSVSDAVVGCVGPATKGPLNQLTTFTDEGNFVNVHGRPVNRMYGPRGLIRYSKKGNKGVFCRIAGKNVKAATVTLYDATGKKAILILTAASMGSWANDDLKVSVTYNGTPSAPTSYNVLVYFLGQLVEDYLVLDNGIVVSRINSGSTRMSAVLAPGAGATFPAQTINPITQVVQRVSFSGGDDGAFAKTESLYSSTGGVAGRRFFGKMDAIAGSRVWANLATISAQQAAKAVYYGTTGVPVVPGTFTVRIPTGVGTWVELSDNGNLSYGPGGAGLGLLSPSAGAHVGFVDYRTGEFGVKLAGGPTTFLAGTVDAIFVRANAESVGATAAGVGSYAGNLSQSPLGVGYFNANKVAISVPIEEHVGTDTVGGATTANSTTGLKTLAGWIIPGSVVLTVEHDTLAVPDPVYDDGFGGWRTADAGGGTAVVGAINYRTGTFTVTWPTTAFPANGRLLARYDILVIDMGGGAVPGSGGVYVAAEAVQPNHPGNGTGVYSSGDTNAAAILGPIERGTVKFVITGITGPPSSTATVYDDGVGGWLDKPRGTPGAVAVTGTIDYNTGAWSVTPTGATAVSAAATVTASYTQKAEDKARRALRGVGGQTLATGAQFQAGGVNVGVVFDAPAAANSFNGSTYLDHRTGAFGFKLNLSPLGVGTQSFDVQDNGTMTAVYVPATILGFGDGTAVTFTGTLAPSPFRRENNRIQGFQGAQASQPAAGEPQVTFSKLGATDAADYWSENVVALPDPANSLNYRSGLASIKWSSAPLAEEAVFVVADETVLHFVAKYPGDIGNERTVLTDGFNVLVDADPTLAGTYRAQVFFNGVGQESFGQAVTLDELVTKINDPVNGSDLITAVITPSGGFLGADVTGSGQRCGLGGAFTVADVIGTKVGQTYTGLQMFSNPETVPLNWIMVPGQWHRQVITALQTLCEKKGRRAIGIIPAPDLDDPIKHRDFFNGSYNATSPGGLPVPTVTVPFPPQAAINSSQLATIVPWVQYFDAYTNEEVFEPADGEMAQLVAGTPAPWQPIAGLRRGQVNITGLRYSASADDRDLIYGVVGSTTEIVNTIIRKEGRGLLLYGQRTAQRSPSALDRINVRWTVNVIQNLVDLISQEFVFEINDPILWREVAAALNKVLQPIVERRGLTDAFVVCDGTTTTADMIDRLQMGAKLFIKPARAAEYIVYDLVLTPTGANFEDVKVAG